MQTRLFHFADKQRDCRFDVALVSLFWLAAGMGLPASLPPQYADGTPDYGIVLYFVSFVLVLNWTLLQVFMWILLSLRVPSGC